MNKMNRLFKLPGLVMAILILLGLLTACAFGITPTGASAPASMQITERVIAVEAGGAGSFVIKEDGSLWGWPEVFIIPQL